MSLDIVFNLVVWGPKYINWFCEYSLVSMLSKNNLPSIHFNEHSRFQIITTKVDWLYLQNNKNFHKLQNLIKVDFINIIDVADESDLTESQKYSVMSKGQCITLQDSFNFDVIFWLYADLIWSDGSIKKALNHLYSNKEAVFSPGPICEFENVKKFLKRNKISISRNQLTGKKLVSLALNSMHNISKNNFASNPYVSITPSYRLWKLDNNGFIMHNFHLHMVCHKTNFIKKRGINKFEGSLDGDLIPLLYDSLLNLHITKGEDDVFFISLAEEYDQDLTFDENSPKNVAAWAEKHTQHIHKLFYSKYIVFKFSKLKKFSLIDELKNCEQFIFEVDKFLMLPDLLKYNLNFKGFIGRLEKVSSMLKPPNLIELKDKILKILKAVGIL